MVLQLVYDITKGGYDTISTFIQQCERRNITTLTRLFSLITMIKLETNLKNKTIVLVEEIHMVDTMLLHQPEAIHVAMDAWHITNLIDPYRTGNKQKHLPCFLIPINCKSYNRASLGLNLSFATSHLSYATHQAYWQSTSHQYQAYVVNNQPHVHTKEEHGTKLVPTRYSWICNWVKIQCRVPNRTKISSISTVNGTRFWY